MTVRPDPLAGLLAGDLPAVVDGRGEAASATEVMAGAERIERDLASVCAPGGIVAVAGDAAWVALAAVYATLRSGFVYVPVEAGRWEAELDELASLGVPVAAIVRDGQPRPVRPRDHAAPPFDAVPGRGNEAGIGQEPLAYVVRSSGTTGRPKAVAQSRDSLAHFLGWAAGELRLGAHDVVFSQAGWSSDIALLDLLAPIGTGARLVLAPPAARRFPAQLLRIATDRGTTVWQSVPSTWRPIVAHGAPLPPLIRLLLLTAEAFAHDDWVRLRHLLPPAARLLNVYGSSESNDATVWEVTERALAAGEVFIGSPLPGVDVAIVPVDSRHDAAGGVGAELGDGIVGELVVWGPMIFEGYLGDPHLTASRRRPRPDGGRGCAYWTGDLVRSRPDGHLQVLGRLDRRRKVQGQWVDLGAVESVAAAHPRVDVAAAEVVESARGSAIGLAVTQRGPGTMTAVEVRRWCRSRLRPHEAPTLVRVLDRMPLTASGKVDRRIVGVELEGQSDQREGTHDR